MNTNVRLSRDQVADLLFRYPHVSDSEAKLILGFLRHGRHLDVGMLTADRKLKPHLDSFMEDHAKHFRLGLGEVSGVVAAIAGFLLFCAIVFEAMSPAAG
jgi:hypothetical protein